MNDTFRQSMAWLHTWAGLVLSWVLYFMFITGTAGYFNHEITHWMQPEVPFANTSISQTSMLSMAERRLNQIAAEAPTWFVDFPTGRDNALSIWWQDLADETTGQEGEWRNEILDPQTGELIEARKTGGGELLYQMHYALYYIPTTMAYWLTSLSAMFMLMALITGIIIHKKIFKDFFTFRSGKKQRSWLDMHNVFSVLPLPFHLMITYSGLVLLMFTTMPGVITASYGTDEVNLDRFYDEAFAGSEHKDAADIAASNITLSAVLPDVEVRWGKNNINYIGIENRGDINAHIELSQQGYSGINYEQSLTYNAVNGGLQHSSEDSETAVGATQFYNVMSSLHEGLFANTILRWLYFLSGLMGAGMVATGAILWVSKRQGKLDKKGQPKKGLVLVENLNVGIIVGLPIAIAVYFWTNRLIPTEFSGRADWEVHALFITWVLALLYPMLRPIKQAWIDSLSMASLLYILLPVLNLLTTDRYLSISILQGDWVMAGFDLSMLVFGLVLGMAALKMQGKPSFILSTNKLIVTKHDANAHSEKITP